MKSNNDVVMEISDTVLAQKGLLEHLSGINLSLKWFLSTIISAAKECGVKKNPSGLTEHTEAILLTRTAFQDFVKSNPELIEKNVGGCSDELIAARLRQLTKLKVCKRESYKTKESKGGYSLFIIKDLAPLAALPPKIKRNKEVARRRTKTEIRLQQDIFLNLPGQIFLRDHKSIDKLIHQAIFNGILDAAMRISQKDERRRIRVVYKILGNPLEITAFCSGDENAEMAILTDQRAMRAILAYCRKEITKRRIALQEQHGEQFRPSMIPNLFRLDIHDLLELMGHTRKSTTNIDKVVGMMQRLKDTQFQVDASKNNWFREKFTRIWGKDGSTDNKFEFRFLNSVSTAVDHEANDLFGISAELLRPRYYTFELDSGLFYSLILDDDSTLFTSHKALGEENSGYIQRFYNWLRMWFASGKPELIALKWYDIHYLHDVLLSASRFDNFRKNFLRALENKVAKGCEFKIGVGGTAYVYGFYCHYEVVDGIERFRFERDINDPIVGVNSIHNQLKRKEMLVYLENDKDVIEGEVE